jgi:hypothetical protein
MAPLHRWLLKTARTIHVYTTLFGLFLLLFFAITGFMLNHETWFLVKDANASPPVPVEGSVPSDWLAKPTLRAHLDNPDDVPQPEGDENLAVPDKLPIVELMRDKYRATGSVLDFNEKEAKEVTVIFLGPGHRVEAVIQRKDGAAKITSTSEGFAGLVTDLHKGKSEGVVWSRGWSLVIDAVCALTIVMSATGVYLWWSLKSRGRYGLPLVALGILVSLAIFYFTIR